MRALVGSTHDTSMDRLIDSLPMSLCSVGQLKGARGFERPGVFRRPAEVDGDDRDDANAADDDGDHEGSSEI